MKKIFDIKIIRNRKRRIIRINQFHYLNEIFDELHMIANKHIQTTFFMNKYNFFRSTESNDEHINSKNYQYKIDKLMYAAIHIRSNIVFAIERFNQYFNDLTIHHEQTLMILLRYVRFIIDFNIIYKMKSNVSENSNSSKNFKLKTFLNFDYVVDKFNENSFFKYVYMFVEKSIT